MTINPTCKTILKATGIAVVGFYAVIGVAATTYYVWRRPPLPGPPIHPYRVACYDAETFRKIGKVGDLSEREWRAIQRFACARVADRSFIKSMKGLDYVVSAQMTAVASIRPNLTPEEWKEWVDFFNGPIPENLFYNERKTAGWLYKTDKHPKLVPSNISFVTCFVKY